MPQAFIPFALLASAFGMVAVLKSKRRGSHEALKNFVVEEAINEDGPELNEIQNLKEEIRGYIRDGSSFNVRLEEFPYYLSERTKELLIHTVWVQLKQPENMKWSTCFPCQSKSVLLCGPRGSELYQEVLVKALANYLQARVLFMDSERLLNEEEVDKITKRRSASESEESSRAKSNHDVTDNSSSSHKQMVNNMLALAALIGATVMTSSTSSSAGGASPSSSSAANARTGSASSSGASPSGSDSTFGNQGSAADRETWGTDAVGHSLRLGDRVTYLNSDGLNSSRPSRGATGRVICKYDTVGVQFDQPVPGGNSLEGRCHRGHGHLCFAHDLQVDTTARVKEEVNKTVAALFEVLQEEKDRGPLIVFLRGAQQLEGCSATAAIVDGLEKLDGHVVFLGSHAQSLDQKAKGQSLLLDSFVEGSYEEEGLEALFYQTIKLQAPTDPSLLEEWERKMEQDAELFQEQLNRSVIQGVLMQSRVRCPDIDLLSIPGRPLKVIDAEDLVGWATSHYLKGTEARGETPNQDGENLVIPWQSLEYGLRMLRALEDNSTTLAKVEQVEKKEKKLSPDMALKKLKRSALLSKFEGRILDVVVPASEVNVRFDEIGALENVKAALRESVMLPLQRPELFMPGQLVQPCHGILLFGPPGTGKTMLAKAVATEAGANFINILVSDIFSKWLGDAEKTVRALFSVARKIAPTVIFVDEVDSLLGKRGQLGEHETVRKVKNEFMASWEGLRSKPQERVLVLAATNRPFDLDDAIIRRFPRRLMVALPDSENRAKILQLILARAELAEGFNFAELAAMTEGYSGSDLKNLCIAAAHIPIREMLQQEEKQQELTRRDAERLSKGKKVEELGEASDPANVEAADGPADSGVDAVTGEDAVGTPGDPDALQEDANLTKSTAPSSSFSADEATLVDKCVKGGSTEPADETIAARADVDARLGLDDSGGGTMTTDGGKETSGGSRGEEGSEVPAPEKQVKSVIECIATVEFGEEIDANLQQVPDGKSVRREAVAPTVVLRPLTMDDMRKARLQISASTSPSAGSMTELESWNAKYGEGGSRKVEVLTYFM